MWRWRPPRWHILRNFRRRWLCVLGRLCLRLWATLRHPWCRPAFSVPTVYSLPRGIAGQIPWSRGNSFERQHNLGYTETVPLRSIPTCRVPMARRAGWPPPASSAPFGVLGSGAAKGMPRCSARRVWCRSRGASPPCPLLWSMGLCPLFSQLYLLWRHRSNSNLLCGRCRRKWGSVPPPCLSRPRRSGGQGNGPWSVRAVPPLPHRRSAAPAPCVRCSRRKAVFCACVSSWCLICRTSRFRRAPPALRRWKGPSVPALPCRVPDWWRRTPGGCQA